MAPQAISRGKQSSFPPAEQGECPRRPRMNLRNGISPTCVSACASERGRSSNGEMDAAAWTEESGAERETFEQDVAVAVKDGKRRAGHGQS